MTQRLVLALRAVLVSLMGVPYLGAFIGGLPPPVAIPAFSKPRAIFAALVAAAILGTFFGGLSPPAAFLYWTTLIIGSVIAALMVARLAATLSVTTPNVLQMVATTTVPANKKLETAADYRTDDDAGLRRRMEVVLPPTARFRPQASLSI